MSNAIPSRLGQADGAGDTRALFLKVFAGEVLSAFHRESAFRQRHTVRQIASGKSAQFPVTGRASAYYHTPGEEILGGVIRANEKLITIEDLLIAPTFIPNIDEAMNHYDVRSIYSGEVGDILGRAYDQAVARTGILNARAAAVLAELSGGATANDAAMLTDGTVLYNAIFNAGVTLDTKDLPAGDRSAFTRPVQYALVVKSEKPIQFELNQGALPNGSIAVGNVGRINSIEMVKTNNLPSADDRLNTAIQAIRRADYSTTAGLVQHRSAVGTVQLQDVTMESEYDMRRQGTLMVGKFLVGHGGLRPEAGVELRTADPAA